MSEITFNCPECGGHLSVDEKGAGMTVPCPECKKSIRIPPQAKDQAVPREDKATVPPALPAQATQKPPKPFVANAGEMWTVSGAVTLGFFILCTLMYYFGYETTEGSDYNSGLMHNRTVGVFAGCMGQVGGLMMILIGIASDCRAYLRRLSDLAGPNLLVNQRK